MALGPMSRAKHDQLMESCEKLGHHISCCVVEGSIGGGIRAMELQATLEEFKGYIHGRLVSLALRMADKDAGSKKTRGVPMSEFMGGKDE